MIDAEITAESLFTNPQMLSKFLDDISVETQVPFIERIKEAGIDIEINGKYIKFRNLFLRGE